jgi:hypothetical protein
MMMMMIIIIIMTATTIIITTTTTQIHRFEREVATSWAHGPYGEIRKTTRYDKIP